MGSGEDKVIPDIPFDITTVDLADYGQVREAIEEEEEHVASLAGYNDPIDPHDQERILAFLPPYTQRSAESDDHFVRQMHMSLRAGRLVGAILTIAEVDRDWLAELLRIAPAAHDDVFAATYRRRLQYLGALWQAMGEYEDDLPGPTLLH